MIGNFGEEGEVVVVALDEIKEEEWCFGVVESGEGSGEVGDGACRPRDGDGDGSSSGGGRLVKVEMSLVFG